MPAEIQEPQKEETQVENLDQPDPLFFNHSTYQMLQEHLPKVVPLILNEKLTFDVIDFAKNSKFVAWSLLENG